MIHSPLMLRLSALVFLSVGFMAAAHGQGSSTRWFVRTDLQGLASVFSGTEQRDTLQNVGFFVRADYLERGGITVGYNRTNLDFQSATEGITQDNLFLSGRWNTTPDWASGRFTLRLDGHAVSNDDATGGTDDVTVFAPQLSYLNFEETFYFDIGLSRSSYGSGLSIPSSLDVDQVTPTLGFGTSEQRDWLQLRAYLISPSNPERAQNQKDTAALEVKWTHWLARPGFLGVNNLRLSLLGGDRIYAVDPDAGTVYNLTDLQTGGASIGAEWVPSERNRVLLIFGVEEYEDNLVGDKYRNGFLYLNLTHQWN